MGAGTGNQNISNKRGSENELIKALLIVYEIALIAIGIWFCNRMRIAYREYKTVKKRYCLAPRYIRKGHTYEPTKAEIKPQLRAKQIELVGWALIIFADFCACIDRLIWILK